MPPISDTVLEAFRTFRDNFCQSRHTWTIEKDICNDSLRALDAKLDCGDEARKKALDSLAENMIDFIEKRVRHLMREEFEAINGRDHPPAKKVETFKKHIDFYDACYLQSIAEIERFDGEHPLHPVSDATLKHAKSGYAHFGTLAMTYIDMMVPEF